MSYITTPKPLSLIDTPIEELLRLRKVITNDCVVRNIKLMPGHTVEIDTAIAHRRANKEIN